MSLILFQEVGDISVNGPVLVIIAQAQVGDVLYHEPEPVDGVLLSPHAQVGHVIDNGSVGSDTRTHATRRSLTENAI